MPDFGPQSGYIYAAYAAAALILGAMILFALASRRSARLRLAALERDAQR